MILVGLGSYLHFMVFGDYRGRHLSRPAWTLFFILRHSGTIKTAISPGWHRVLSSFCGIWGLSRQPSLLAGMGTFLHFAAFGDYQDSHLSRPAWVLFFILRHLGTIKTAISLSRHGHLSSFRAFGDYQDSHLSRPAWALFFILRHSGTIIPCLRTIFT